MPRKSQNSQKIVSQNENDENSMSDEGEATVGGGGDSLLGTTIPLALQEQLINDIIRYVLICQRKGVVVKRAEISKDILKNNKKHFNGLFEEVCNRLENIFGLKVYRPIS